MNDNVWVCKPEGTIQCEDAKEITLEEARAELVQLIGEANVLEGCKKSVIVPKRCGLATGVSNAFEITRQGYEILTGGTVGPMGWDLCPADADGSCSTRVGSAGGKNPGACRSEMVGSPLRVYHEGDAITDDYVEDRANIVLGTDERITDVWFG